MAVLSQVNIDNPGKGYRYPPTVTVNGVGINAELITTIDGLGRINGVSIINPERITIIILLSM